MHQVIVGDSREVLGGLLPAQFHCIVFSPPYLGQRDYRVSGQMGSETSVRQYVDHLMKVFDDLYRVMRPDGTLFMNIGDKYQHGDLALIPHRLAIALADTGWHVHNDIIWHKPNPVPSSAKQRFTVGHEHILFLTRSRDYWFDQDAVREPHATADKRSISQRQRTYRGKFDEEVMEEMNSPRARTNRASYNPDHFYHPLGRNKRDVWTVPVNGEVWDFCQACGTLYDADQHNQPCPACGSRSSWLRHFAAYPPALIEPCIRSGCPVGGLVLDPFCGTGTTLRVAKRLGRNAVGIELNEAYARLAQARVDNT